MEELPVEEAYQGRDAATLGGGNEGCWAINMWPAERLGNAHWAGSCTSLGCWVELAIYSCGSSATCGGAYLATLPTFTSCSSATTHNISCSSTAACGSYCSSAAACANSCIFFNTFGCPCSHLASPGCSSGFLDTPDPNFSCGYPAGPSCPCSQSATYGHPCGHLTLSSVW